MRMFEACGLGVLLPCNDAPSDVTRGRRVVSASLTPDHRRHSMPVTVSSLRRKAVFSRYLHSPPRSALLLTCFVRDPSRSELHCLLGLRLWNREQSGVCELGRVRGLLAALHNTRS